MVHVYTESDFWGGKRILAGIDTQSFNNVYAAQNTPNICWAACIESVMKYYGLNVDQSDFAANYCGIDYWGNVKDCPASIDMITKYAHVCTKTHCVRMNQYHGRPDANVLFNLSQNNVPVIAAYNTGGSVGHAVVITGISVKRSFFGDTLYSITVRDPEKNLINVIRQGKKEYNAESFLGAVYAWWVPTIEKH